MKKIFAALCCLGLSAGLLPFSALAAQPTINVYNWGQYISDGSDGCIDVNAEFTARTGIKVNYMPQAEPTRMPSRCWISRLLGMVGVLWKYLR